MNKEILDITKKFHDTYEKLASEYTYETREDTKVFDINSNNGKLMYATVNEIVSSILKENKQLKENYDRIYNENCKLREEHNITDISLLDENQELKKQLEQYQEEVCILDMRTDENIKYKNQQKEFIEYLEDKIKSYKNRDSYMVADILGSYDLNNIELELLEEILQKYKEIIGVSDENNMGKSK